MFYKDERLAVFIDGANLNGMSRAIGLDIDFGKLRSELMQRGKLKRLAYYARVTEGEDFSPLRPLLDWLSYNGYQVISRPSKTYTDNFGNPKIKGSINTLLSVDAMEMIDVLDHVVIASGDGEMLPVVEAMQRVGVRVSVIGTVKASPPMVADDLRRACSNFIELDDWRHLLEKNHERVD